MNIYTRKNRWKYVLFIAAVFIGVGSLWYTNNLVKKLSYEEHKKVELWAKATSLIINSDLTGVGLEFLLSVIQNNETVPVIEADKKNHIYQQRNLDSSKMANPIYARHKLENMMKENPSIEIQISDKEKHYLYYSRSIILTKLIYYPLIQLGIILLFIVIAYFAFDSSRKAEQNQVWVGLTKETAHQLGTPISSLLAWVEILKLKNKDDNFVNELEKDVKRLSKIADRFSKIGSKPVLLPNNIIEVISNTINYLKSRSSNKIIFNLNSEDDKIIVPINPPLFEWVIENICKNSMDAIEGDGEINVYVINESRSIFIDIQDDGKGIIKSMHKTIFKPGYTTKERGWGLGLSLTKRIIEEYHNGKIFVTASEPGKGTTIRIILNK
jgi:signal transduction histidine kinase